MNTIDKHEQTVEHVLEQIGAGGGGEEITHLDDEKEEAGWTILARVWGNGSMEI
jgi:hypothetical protein